MPSPFLRRVSLCAAFAFTLASLSAPASAAPSQSDLDAIVQRAFAQNLTPGMAIAIVRDGKIVFEGGYGFANVAKKTPVTPGTPFAIGSLSKQFTAAAVLMLAARGKLSLDDTVAKYVPSLPNAAQITLRELLWQTSGLHDYPHPNEHRWPFSGSVDSTTILSILATDPSDFPPGTKWAYSNANYAVLTRVVEIASGMPYGKFLAANVFGPLAMNQSGYGLAAQQVLPVATAYTGAAPFTSSLMTMTLDLYSGAGGIVSSAHDMGLWMNGLMGKRFLDAASLADLWSTGHLAGGSATNYAMGFIPTSLDEHREVWHNGYAPFAGGYCYDAIFPDDGIGIAILTNEDPTDVQTMPQDLTRALFEAMIPPAGAAPGEDPTVTARVKRYWNDLAAGTLDVKSLTPEFAKIFTAQFQALLQSSVSALGTPKSWTYLGKFPDQKNTTRYEYRVELPSGPRTFQLWLSPDGKIAGSYLKP